jgi:hypothetical protein
VAKLEVRMIPKPLWGRNVRSEIRKSKWDRIRKKVYKKARYKCEVCGTKGRLHGHEVWQYNERRRIQKLVDIIALCWRCHEAVHYGYAQSRGNGGRAFGHLQDINRWGRRKTRRHIDNAFADYRRRSKLKDWKLDLRELRRF